MFWVYLSPHFDDIALSCGGLVWQQSKGDEKVEIWTICAGEPPEQTFTQFAESLHDRWETDQDAIAIRKREDHSSTALLGAQSKHFSIPDCIYRRDSLGNPLYASEAAIFSAIHPAEDELVDHLAIELAKCLQHESELGTINIVSPMAIGRHVDHRLTRAAAEQLYKNQEGITLWYYADFPYVMKYLVQLARLREPTWEAVTFELDDAAVRAWTSGFTAHATQLSTFWPDADTAQAAFDGYAQLMGGVRLWRQSN